MVNSGEPSEFIFTLIRDMSIESLSSQDSVDGRSVLHQAAERDEYGVVEELIRRGVNVNVRAADGSLPLTLAVEEDSWYAAVELVKAGAEGVDELLDNGLTPLTKAALKGEREILEAIAERGNVDLDKVLDSGKTHRQLLDEGYEELRECHAGSLEHQILTAEEVYSILLV